MNRKEFMKNLGLTLVGIPTISESDLPENPKTPIQSSSSWSEIASHFRFRKDFVYFNNGTMGISPDIVLKAIQDGFERVATEGRYPSEHDLLKKPLSKLLGVDSKTIAITKNVTEGINIACWGNALNAGDEVLMTTHEHVGGCAAWLYRVKTEGIRIRTFQLGSTAEETFSNFKKAIRSNTKIAAIPHIPCTIGQILPIKEMCQFAKEKGITTIVDGAHPLGMLRLNITDLGCDYYAGCLHKWLLAPLGMGFLYIHPDRLERTKIHNLGAYSIAKFDMTPDSPSLDLKDLVQESQRFCTGTYSGPLYEAAIKAIEWYESIGVDRVEARVKALSLQVQEGLKIYKDKVKILSPVEEISRGAQTSFSLLNGDAKKFINYVRESKYKFILRHVHEGGLDAVRVSTHYYNNETQIENLMATLGEFLKK